MDEVEVYVGVKSWTPFLIRGLIAIAVGIILLFWPGSTIRVLAILIGILALVDGLIETVYAVVLLFKTEKMGLLLVRGLIGILIGLLLIFRTRLSLAVVIVFIAIWAILAGVAQLIVAFDMPAKSGRGLLGFSGLISVALGILLLAFTIETVYAVIVIFSIFIIIGGIVNIVYAFHAKKLEKELLAA